MRGGRRAKPKRGSSGRRIEPVAGFSGARGARTLTDLDAAGVVLPEARARLEEIIVRVIAA